MIGSAHNIQDNQENLLKELYIAILLNKTAEVMAIIDQHPSILNQTYSDGKTPIFYAIASDNPDIVLAIIEKDPSVLTQTLPDGYTPIFQAISLGKLDAVKTIIEKDSSVLTKTLPNGYTPIFQAISLGKLDAVKTIIEKDSSVLTQTLPDGYTPIFRAIFRGKLDAVKTIIEKDPSVLTQTLPNGYTPIFPAISLGKLDAVKTIIEKDPSVLTRTLPNGYTPIFHAISLGKLDAVKTIIEKDPSVLTQTLPDGYTPIFHAISLDKLDAVKTIIEKDPSVLTQTLPNEMMVITYATQSCLSSSGSPDEKAKRSEILTIILKKQFGENITPNDQNDLEELLFNKSLLNGLHSKLDSLNGFNYLKNAFEKNNPENIFDSIYKDLFQSVDKNIPVELGDGSKMYIFSSNLKKHMSFFIFHTDANNKLESISYCDGNYAYIKSQKIKNSSTHIKGITTFHLKDAIDYSESFAKDFIYQNSKGKSIFDLYDKFKKSEISGVKIDFTKTTHSIPTKIQKRGNCGFKSTSLLARFIIEKKDPNMNFDYDKKTKKPIGAGYDEYKKFKTNLIKKSLDSVSKLKEKISTKLDSFSRYLKNEIENILGTKDDYVEAKWGKTQIYGVSSQKEVGSAILERDAPRASCFPFLSTCFGKSKDTSSRK